MNNFEIIKTKTLNEAKEIIRNVLENKCNNCIYKNTDCNAKFCDSVIINWLEFNELYHPENKIKVEDHVDRYDDYT